MSFTPNDICVWSYSGGQDFSKLDLCNAYHLVRIHEGDEWKTAFNTPSRHYEYLLMPSGLSNAPAVFQALVNDVLKDFINIHAFVYLDDILIFSKDLDTHIQHVQAFFRTTCTSKQRSASFTQPAPLSLGSTSLLTKSLWTLQKYPQFWIGPFHRLVSNCNGSLVLQIFTESSFAITVLCLHPFMLSLPSNAPLNGTKEPTWLSPAEHNYDVGDRELLAVKMALEEWRHWLERVNHPFMALTDHKNLEYLPSAKRLNPRQARWALFFRHFNFSLSYRPRMSNQIP